MIKISIIFLCVGFFSCNLCFSQTIDIKGIVVAKSDIEGIHVINKTSQKFTTTNAFGDFKIGAKLNDTIVFSSIKYRLETIIVSKEIIKSKKLIVPLVEHIIELDEVTVGKILTGNLLNDISNSDVERSIDFYDVGIPGYTGKPKTQSERRLYDADHGKYINSFNGGLGLGLAINVNKILNKISGRTKKLKEHVRLESNDILMNSIKARLSEDFFSVYSLNEAQQMDFFYFCSEDKNFNKRCQGKSIVEIIDFLKEKIVQYNSNLETEKD
jgi:hypothetical protein